MAAQPTVIPFPAAVELPPRTGAPTRPELNTRILWSLARYVLDTYGEVSLRRIANDAGIRAEELDGKSHWVPHSAFENFLAGARALMPDDETFKRASAHRLRDGYGPFRFVLWAVTPTLMYKKGVTNMDLISTISRYAVLESTDNSIRGRYTSDRGESRLMCLSRQSQIEAIPTLWGLPPAQLTEKGCIGHGDGACEYQIRWYVKSSWLPTVIGGIAGLALAALILFGSELIPRWALATLPLLGGAAGYIFDLRRTHQANIKHGDEVNDALRELAREDAQARAEMLELHQRLQDWGTLVVQKGQERDQRLQKLVNRLQERRSDTLRGFSHDIRNPLSVLRTASAIFGHYVEGLGPEGPEILADHDAAVTQMERLLQELVEVATAPDGQLIRVEPETVDVSKLTDKLRKRLRALTHGRDIRVTVFGTREAPDQISTDLMILDRVMDNLLTNATKYTERGSILVEVDGTPGYLTIKISDTGRGIEAEDLRAIFEPGGSDVARRAPASWGVGLSVVLQLLAQIGGRLEVMSKPNVGTTFWAHFPEEIRPPAVAFDEYAEEGTQAYAELVDRVVTIRRV